MNRFRFLISFIESGVTHSKSETTPQDVSFGGGKDDIILEFFCVVVVVVLEESL